MTIQRMDNVAIVVDDLDAAIAFFTALGLELGGRTQVDGPVVDRLAAIEGVRADLASMHTPDGHSRLELTQFISPAAIVGDAAGPAPNTLGLHWVMFTVDDLDDTVTRLRAHGGELIGEVVNYKDIYALCYLRGPAGIIVALAQQIG